jgi:hypothetical protein
LIIGFGEMAFLYRQASETPEEKHHEELAENLADLEPDSPNHSHWRRPVFNAALAQKPKSNHVRERRSRH